MAINIKGISGKISSDDDTKILKEMADTLKSINDESKKQANLNLAGLLGAPLLGGQAEGIGDAEGGGGLYGELGGGKKAYEEVIYEGEKMVAEINASTGQINNLLTIEEAEQKGILDEKGGIRAELRDQKGVFDKITKELEKENGVVKLNKDQLLGLSTSYYKSVLLTNDLNTATEKVTKEILNMIGEKSGSLPDDLNNATKKVTKEILDMIGEKSGLKLDLSTPERIQDTIDFLNQGVDLIDSFGDSGIGQFITFGGNLLREGVQHIQEKSIQFVNLLRGD
jgi:hypothetical protein